MLLDFSDRTGTGISKLISRCAGKNKLLRAGYGVRTRIEGRGLTELLLQSKLSFASMVKTRFYHKVIN